MLSKPFRLWAFLCLLLALQLATAQSFQLVQRDDPAPAPPPNDKDAPPPPPPTDAAKPDDNKPQDNGDNAKPGDDAKPPETTGEPKSGEPPKSSMSMTASATEDKKPKPTGKDDKDGKDKGNDLTSILGNSTFVNATIPDGQLPLKPRLTPGWGVAGTIMLLTGIGYTLVGIKNRWVHTFFSTAYLAALGVAVLIVYVMNVPVNNALQGGYIVAIIMAGCAIGAASTFFKELTEGLGCALGGFCFSMWLLCLVPGGLLDAVASKAIFISCFTLVAFGFYFSRYTRDWALIVMIAFGGSTVTVLGIDCFSRAGLKEFWAWIWDLNDNLFPLGAVTYPVTKGMRVEAAAIIILCLVGIISQIKLWRIVRERREKRAAERAEGQRNLQEEEENVGREIEATTARERREWERIYGDGTVGSTTASHFSVGDDSSEKRLHTAYVYSTKHNSANGIELADMSESSHSHRGQDALMAGEDEDGKVVVRVVAEDVPEGEIGDDRDMINEKRGTVQSDAATLSALQAAERRASRVSAKSKRSSRQSQKQQRASLGPMTPAPDVVPLPFNVPAGEDDGRSDRSSVATFADEDEHANAAAPKRHSIVKRLSQGSAELLRSFSQRSARTDTRMDSGDSSEDLVETQHHIAHDDSESLAANVDDESDGESVANSDARPQSKSIEITAELADKVTKSNRNSKRNSSSAKDNSKRASKADSAKPVEEVQPSEPREDSPVESVQARSEKPASITSAGSVAASLTKDRLPRSLSRIAMSYRTNEWTKHLSNADTPAPEDVAVNQPLQSKKVRKEKVRPVDVEELQRTAEEGIPAAPKRSESRLSQASAATAPAPTASPAPAPVPSPSPIPTPLKVDTSASPVPSNANRELRSPTSPPIGTVLNQSRSMSGIGTIAEETDTAEEYTPTAAPAQTASSIRSPSISASPQLEAQPRAPVSGVVSYSSPQTLIGQREMVLRSRSQGNLAGDGHQSPMLGAGSDTDSIHDYSMYAAALASTDADDMPLSQRRDMMRSSSRLSLNPSVSNGSLRRVDSSIGAENFTFNSHQPQRNSGLPTHAAREAKLANFRMSVSQELRAGNAMLTSTGRETPFTSANTLLGGREAEVQRNIEMQRHVMMGQKEAEAQRRDSQRRERETSDRMFEERMRSGGMMDVHREAIRKMQRHAKD